MEFNQSAAQIAIDHMPDAGFLWIDLPDVFMDFVFEIMDRSALLRHGYRFPDS